MCFTKSVRRTKVKTLFIVLSQGQGPGCTMKWMKREEKDKFGEWKKHEPHIFFIRV